jgi:hypothetical protein
MSAFNDEIDLDVLQYALQNHADRIPATELQTLLHYLQAFQQQEPGAAEKLCQFTMQSEAIDLAYDLALTELRRQYQTQQRAKSLELSIGSPLTAEINHTITQLATTIEQLLTHRQQLSRTTAIEQILKTLEKSHLTPTDLTHLLTQPPQQTETILHGLWQQGYIDRLTAPFPYILFPSLRNPQYRATLPSPDAFLTLTAKGYFYLYPLIKRPDRLVSA